MKLPDAFVTMMKRLLQDEAEPFFLALDASVPVSVRYNPAKVSDRTTRSWHELWEGVVPWASQAHYLRERPAFTFDPCLHGGAYYVQEASSMFVEQALRAILQRRPTTDEPLMMLDLCAAPGGKSTLALSLLPEGSLLVANEVVGARARILQENLIKWGHPSVMVTQNQAATFGQLGPFFDVVLVDAPCSGEGLFRKDDGAVGEWSPEAVKQCAIRQSAILKDSLPALKPGGYLLYSTCTYNTEEDEAVVEALVEQEGFTPVPLPVKPEWGIKSALRGGEAGLPVYRFLPHRTKGEGFFLGLLQKPLDENEGEEGWKGAARHSKSAKSVRHARQGGKQPVAVPETVKKGLVEPNAYHWSVMDSGLVRALPGHLAAAIMALETSLNVLYAGIAVGEVKGAQVLPHPALALSTALNRSAFPVCELDQKQAVDYLRREALVLPESCPNGWVLVTHKEVVLGWVKNLGSRANNGWPAEWRIRSGNPFA